MHICSLVCTAAQVHKDGHNSSASKQNCDVQTSEQVGYAVLESVWSSMFNSKQ